MDYLNKYQTNNICNYCKRFNNDCLGQMWNQENIFVNNFCPQFTNRDYSKENTEYHLKKFTEYTSKNN